jgi:thioredoxin-dependent peroxiredoxin
MAVEEGKAAPAFTLTDAAGKKVSLGDFAGKDVILYFYPKDDTPGCTKEACGFRDAWKELQKRAWSVVGVSPDAAGVPREVREEVQAAVPAALGPGQEGDDRLRRLGREDIAKYCEPPP